MMMRIELLVCTFNDGIRRVASLLLPPAPWVGYVVSWQQTEGYVPCELPEELVCRADVKVVTLPGVGLSRNRNSCLRHASADICLICDDDCSYTMEGLRAVVEAFERNPDVDMIAFKAKNACDRKLYPTARFNLRERVRGFYVMSIEMALRRERVAGKVWFDEHFGLGSGEFGAGEETVFVADALAAGLNCQYFPVEVVEHHGPTTSVTRRADTAVLRADGAILYLYYRGTMWLRAPLIAWRVSKQTGAGFAYALRSICRGIDAMRKLAKERSRQKT